MNEKAKSKNVSDHETNQLLRSLALGAIVLIVFLSLPHFCSSHSHDHGHDHDHHHHDEPASFKWSKEANQQYEDEHLHHHGHAHDHAHDHGHGHGHDHGHDHGHHAHHHGSQTDKPPQTDMFALWVRALGSTLLISAAPYLLLYFINLDNTDAMKPRLKVLLAFASGGLLGDAFLHLIPHAIHPHSHHEDGSHTHAHPHSHLPMHDEHDHEHGHDMSIGLWVLSGIICFLTVEKCVRLLKGGHGHSHGPSESKKPKAKSDDEKTEDDVKKSQAKKKPNEKGDKKAVAKKSHDEHNDIEISGYLNLAADFTHNFTDGLAIGASYLAGNSIGLVTTITILLHEVPHEIGDFAILIKSGCSKKKAMLLQLVTAVGAFSGTLIALLGTSGEAAPWVLPFTAGGFIYIATVSVLPELLEESTKLKQSIKEIAALLAGVGLMVIIANFE